MNCKNCKYFKRLTATEIGTDDNLEEFGGFGQCLKEEADWRGGYGIIGSTWGDNKCNIPEEEK